MSAPLPHGGWPTPITSELVVTAAALLGEVVVDGGDVWWSESRPDEDGRSAIVRRSADGTATDVLPEPWDARTRVHEYGGGAWRWPTAPCGSRTTPTSGCTGSTPAETPPWRFRRAENIRAALDGELSFHAQVWCFGLPPEEGIEPITIR